MSDAHLDDEDVVHVTSRLSAQRRPITPDQEPDIHNFSTSSSHRLATVTGTQALQYALQRAEGISTSLSALDVALTPTGSSNASPGIRRGYVTEIYGPPGVGKTAFGMQLVSNALHSSDTEARAVWLNTGSPIAHARLISNLAHRKLPEGQEPPSSPPARAESTEELLERFTYRDLSSLPHLLTLIMHPTAIFPPPNTMLLVIDDLSNLIFSSLPHTTHSNDTSHSLQSAIAKRESSRLIQLVESLSSALSSLAASRHLAAVILNKATMSQKGGTQATLKPALAGQAWDPGIDARIVLYRDFPPFAVRDKLTDDERLSWRLAEVVRLGGKAVVRRGVPFLVEGGGLREITVADDDRQQEAILPTQPEVLLPLATYPPVMPLSDLPAMEDDEEEQLVQQGESEFLDLRPGLEEDPELPVGAEARPAKRKATEIADSEDEDEGGSEDEPELPRILSAREMRDQGHEEMLLDEHERHLRAHGDACD